MLKHQFFCDYSEGGHPLCLQALINNNFVQEPGYGTDSVSERAKTLIRQALESPHADINFVAGGTLANLTMIAAMLNNIEAVVAPSYGHIVVNEVGAIEATGHKIFIIEHENGKIYPQALTQFLESQRPGKSVIPKVVYISQSTELGTIYSLAEMQAIRKICDQYDMYLYIDGARLSHAIASDEADFTLADISSLADAFYLGGTKNGALIGEAIIIINDQLKSNFRHHIKQRGAMLAKGRVIGSQFLALFEDDLYLQVAKHANDLAVQLQKGMIDLGIEFKFYNSTNQIFPILTNELIEALQKSYGFHVWQTVDEDHKMVRFITSWATNEINVTDCLNEIKNIILSYEK